ncbi:MAG: SHOCT domain-containing protein [Dehalococcoidia bacterium]|nr:SHOCT domain-containing protein [Dehalococcoidia bacterium]
MAITETREWTAAAARSEVNQKLAEAVQLEGGEVVNLEPFIAKTGGFWKTRLIGALFLSTRDLPTNIQAVVEDGAGGVRVRATVSDRLGFGLRTGVVGRFRTQCLRLLDVLEEATSGPKSADELRELKKLLDDGVITDDEYARRRQELVERL